MAKDSTNHTEWAEVAAKAQALQALHAVGLTDGTLTDKARFLMTLGLTRADAAALLGSSDDSVRVLFAREAKKATSTGTKPGRDSA